MYQFLLNMWRMGRVTESYIDAACQKGRITEEERKRIITTSKF